MMHQIAFGGQSISKKIQHMNSFPELPATSYLNDQNLYTYPNFGSPSTSRESSLVSGTSSEAPSEAINFLGSDGWRPHCDTTGAKPKTSVNQSNMFDEDRRKAKHRARSILTNAIPASPVSSNPSTPSGAPPNTTASTPQMHANKATNKSLKHGSSINNYSKIQSLDSKKIQTKHESIHQNQNVIKKQSIPSHGERKFNSEGKEFNKYLHLNSNTDNSYAGSMNLKSQQLKLQIPDNFREIKPVDCLPAQVINYQSPKTVISKNSENIKNPSPKVETEYSYPGNTRHSPKLSHSFYPKTSANPICKYDNESFPGQFPTQYCRTGTSDVPFVYNDESIHSNTSQQFQLQNTDFWSRTNKSPTSNTNKSHQPNLKKQSPVQKRKSPRTKLELSPRSNRKKSPNPHSKSPQPNSYKTQSSMSPRNIQQNTSENITEQGRYIVPLLDNSNREVNNLDSAHFSTMSPTFAQKALQSIDIYDKLTKSSQSETDLEVKLINASAINKKIENNCNLISRQISSSTSNETSRSSSPGMSLTTFALNSEGRGIPGAICFSLHPDVRSSVNSLSTADSVPAKQEVTISHVHIEPKSPKPMRSPIEISTTEHWWSVGDNDHFIHSDNLEINSTCLQLNGSGKKNNHRSVRAVSSQEINHLKSSLDDHLTDSDSRASSNTNLTTFLFTPAVNSSTSSSNLSSLSSSKTCSPPPQPTCHLKSIASKNIASAIISYEIAAAGDRIVYADRLKPTDVPPMIKHVENQQGKNYEAPLPRSQDGSRQAGVVKAKSGAFQLPDGVATLTSKEIICPSCQMIFQRTQHLMFLDHFETCKGPEFADL